MVGKRVGTGKNFTHFLSTYFVPAFPTSGLPCHVLLLLFKATGMDDIGAKSLDWKAIDIGKSLKDSGFSLLLRHC